MKSYSQFGEDAWIYNYVNLPMKGVFIDVGCGHPTIKSNTYLFETLDWTGLCIDGNEITKQYFEKSRKNSTFVITVISDTEKSVWFEKEHNAEESAIKHNTRTNTKTRTLNSILEEYKIEFIDLLSIDVNGLELDVLQGLDLNKHKPQTIILNYCTLGKYNFTALEYLTKKGYKIKTITEVNFILTR